MPQAHDSSRKPAEYLKKRSELTAAIKTTPYDPSLWLHRARIHSALQFPDLAAGDAYRALMLYEAAIDETSEAAEWIVWAQEAAEEEEEEDVPSPEMPTKEDYDQHMPEVMRLLVLSLMQCGCLRDAYEFWRRAIKEIPEAKDDLEMKTMGSAIAFATGGSSHNSPRRSNDDWPEEDVVKKTVIDGINGLEINGRTDYKETDDAAPTNGVSGNTEQLLPIDVSKCEEALVEGDMDIAQSQLPAQGSARRELYPWNSYEPNRSSREILDLLNERMKEVAPKIEVRATELPNLRGIPDATEVRDGKASEEDEAPKTILQLGLFAAEDMSPGEVILRERTLLTSTNRLHDELCEACNGPLPQLSDENPPVGCEECHDAFFCTQECHDRAQEKYHPAICDADELNGIGQDIPDDKDGADGLYLLLLGRAFALAQTQDLHPLDLDEVKYIWGDFHPYSSRTIPLSYQHERIRPGSATLPYSFHLNILQPLRILTAMRIDPFANADKYDVWVINSLFAKFRGTASGRLSRWDGAPEVCAVHPLWCLGNHSCDPNVTWEWGGEISFTVREKRVGWGDFPSGKPGGIKAGEEIQGYYCDINRSVTERRSWAVGALGGECMCERCVWEAAQIGDEIDVHHGVPLGMQEWKHYCQPRVFPAPGENGDGSTDEEVVGSDSEV